MKLTALLILCILLFINVQTDVVFEFQAMYYENPEAKTLALDKNKTLQCCNKTEHINNCTTPCIPSIDISITGGDNIYHEQVIRNITNLKWYSFPDTLRIVHRTSYWANFSSLNITVYQSDDRSSLLLRDSIPRLEKPTVTSDWIVTRTNTFFNLQTSATIVVSWKLYNESERLLPCKKTGHGSCSSRGYLVCDEGFYGANCSRACHVNGNGYCDNHGNVICDKNYYGSNCAKYCEVNTNGNCSTDGDLRCSQNSYGPGCSIHCNNNDGINCGKCNKNGAVQSYGIDCSVFCLFNSTTRLTRCNLNKTTIKILDLNPINQFVTIYISLHGDSQMLCYSCLHFFKNKHFIHLRNNTKGGGKLIYFENWTNTDELTVFYSENSTKVERQLISLGNNPDPNMSKAVVYKQFLTEKLYIKAWIYYTRVSTNTMNPSTNGCDDTYYGQNCSHRCPSKREQLHGECSSERRWVCTKGWTGDTCLTNTNECDSNPCGNGSCVDTYGSYYCKCRPGMNGKHCEMDVNECFNTELCHHGTCHNTMGSYYCKCDQGWTGKDCDEDINECVLNNNVVCNHGTCTNTNGSYSCACLPGWNGTHCDVDINECKKSMCLDGHCSNTNGSYICQYTSSTRFFTSAYESQLESFQKKNTERSNTYTHFSSLEPSQTSLGKMFHESPIFSELHQKKSNHSWLLASSLYRLDSWLLENTLPANRNIETTVMLENTLRANQNIETTVMLENTLPANQNTETTVMIENTLPANQNIETTVTLPLEYSYRSAISPSSSSIHGLSSQPTIDKYLSSSQTYDQTHNLQPSKILQEPHLSTNTKPILTPTPRTILEVTRSSDGKSYITSTSNMKLSTTTMIQKLTPDKSSFQKWIKENMVLALGILIGVALVLGVVVIFLICKRCKSKAPSPPPKEQTYPDLLKNKRRLTLFLTPEDELIQDNGSVFSESNELSHQTQPTITHINPLYTEQDLDKGSNYC